MRELQWWRKKWVSSLRADILLHLGCIYLCPSLRFPSGRASSGGVLSLCAPLVISDGELPTPFIYQGMPGPDKLLLILSEWTQGFFYYANYELA